MGTQYPRFNSLMLWLLVGGVMANLVACHKKSTSGSLPIATLWIKGADVSYLPQIRQSGIRLYNAQLQPEDMLVTLQRAGVNTIRLRLWHSPTDTTSNLTNVQKLVAEAKSKGFKTLISLHYSDNWADPAKQTTPAKWQQANFATLLDSVFTYTYAVMRQLQPDYIQIGNEINHGFLWPLGHIDRLNQCQQLLQKAISAVRLANANTKIVLHFAGIDNALFFYQQMAGIDYDWIGLSYYPLWHGNNLNSVATQLQTLATTCQKPIFIAETSYPFTLLWNDWTNNIIGSNDQILTNFAATPTGQKAYLHEIQQMVAALPKGIGFCYWGGEWISYKGANATDGSTWENQAFWDFNNVALPILDNY